MQPEVDINIWREVEGLNIDKGLQQTLITENLWLNVIITHSKFIYTPFIYLYTSSIFGVPI